MSLITRCILYITAPKGEDIKQFHSEHFRDVDPGTIAPEEPIRNQFFYIGNFCADNIVASGHSEILTEDTLEFSFKTYKKAPIDEIKKLIKEYYRYHIRFEVRYQQFDTRYTLEGKNCEIIEVTSFDKDDSYDTYMDDCMEISHIYISLLNMSDQEYDKFIKFTKMNRDNAVKIDKTQIDKSKPTLMDACMNILDDDIDDEDWM